MTIQEAIRSGKRIKRKNWSVWYSNNKDCINKFRNEDILADDWEIERKPREIYVSENEKGELFAFREVTPGYFEEKYASRIIKFREVIE